MPKQYLLNEDYSYNEHAEKFYGCIQRAISGIIYDYMSHGYNVTEMWEISRTALDNTIMAQFIEQDIAENIRKGK